MDIRRALQEVPVHRPELLEVAAISSECADAGASAMPAEAPGAGVVAGRRNPFDGARAGPGSTAIFVTAVGGTSTAGATHIGSASTGGSRGARAMTWTRGSNAGTAAPARAQPGSASGPGRAAAAARPRAPPPARVHAPNAGGQQPGRGVHRLAQGPQPDSSQARSRPALSACRPSTTPIPMTTAAPRAPNITTGGAPWAISVVAARTMTRPRRLALTAHARSIPRRVATESTPAAASRSTSARALAMASAAPAMTATGSRMVKDEGRPPRRPEPAEDGQQRDPDRERQPRPGRALEREVVGVADREDQDGQEEGGDPRWQRERQSEAASADGHRPGLARRHQAAGNRLGRRATTVTGSVDDVVERPDRDLECGHRDPEADRGHRIGAGQLSHSARDHAVEQTGKRMGEADQAAKPVDWLDACQRGDLDDLLGLYDERTTLKCDCEGVVLTGHQSLSAYWAPKLESKLASAFIPDNMTPTSDGVQVDYQSYEGKPVRMHFGFTPSGKIAHANCSPLLGRRHTA